MRNCTPPVSKVTELRATFERKERYTVHYANLQQVIKNGLK